MSSQPSTYPPTHSDSRVTAGVASDASAAPASSSPEPSKEQPTQPSPSPARRSLLRRNVGDDDHGLHGRGAEGEKEGEGEELKAMAITADHKPDVPAEQVGVSVGACGGW